MSRELLKRALDYITTSFSTEDDASFIAEIETYLAQPEHEPVGWLYDFQSDNGIVHNWFTPDEAEIEQSHALNIRPLYTTPPDHSARVAELEQRIKELETEAFCDDEENQFLEIEIHKLEQQLALQAKREPVLLSDDDVHSVCVHWMSIGVSKEPMSRFIRAIEQAVLKANGLMGE